jgi:hypothetical protein
MQVTGQDRLRHGRRRGANGTRRRRRRNEALRRRRNTGRGIVDARQAE